MQTNNAPTVADILDRYQAECLPLLAHRTQKDYVRHIAHLKNVFGHHIAGDMKPRDFGAFLYNEGKTRGKIQKVRQLAVLSAAFTQAVSFWFWGMERNVLRDVKRPPSKPRDRLIEDWEFKGIMALAPLGVKLMMRLALKIGQRQGDLLSLKWEDIKDGAIHIHQSKTGKRLAIGIDADLQSILDECFRLPKGGCDGGPYVITKRPGGRYTSEGFRACWQRVVRKWRKLGHSAPTFHDIRALCATRCPSPEVAMRLLGHSNISMTLKVYRRGTEHVQCLPGAA